MTLRAMLQVPPPADPDEFDAQVEDALRVRHANPHLVRYGRSGQAQYGIDGLDPTTPPGEGIEELWPAIYDGVTPDALNSFLRDVLGLGDDRAVYAYGTPERGVGRAEQ